MFIRMRPRQRAATAHERQPRFQARIVRAGDEGMAMVRITGQIAVVSEYHLANIHSKLHLIAELVTKLR